ncbi:MAG TPA: hypothetical protein VHW44_33535 [Pseudonocardiaceae bacterium]|nr:hypothetical protein [Pseudonocardiaceae bacterium]
MGRTRVNQQHGTRSGHWEPDQTAEIETVELPKVTRAAKDPDPAPVAAPPVPPVRPGGRLGSFAGIVAVVLVLLGVGLVVAKLVGQGYGMPGPDGGAVAAQVAGAVLAVPLYLLVSRRTGPVRWVSAAALLVVLVVLLGWFWWR